MLAVYTRALQRRCPLPSACKAWTVGGIWSGATVAFEVVFGHWVAGDSWADLVRNHDVRTGRAWVAVPVAMAVLPELTRGR